MAKLSAYYNRSYSTTKIILCDDNYLSGELKSRDDVRKAIASDREVAYVITRNGPTSISVTAEHIDSYRHAIYAGSEGQVYVGNQSRMIHGGRFMAVTLDDAADYVATLIGTELKKHGDTGFKYTPSPLVSDESFIQWRPATDAECADPSIKWTQEGHSKYGRRMINKERGIWRGLTMMEFYGSGIVD